MKKISIVLISLLFSLIMGQKEIPGSESISGTLLDERMNGSQDLVVDPEMVQQVRMIKVNKEKAFMKKKILSGQKVEIKTFKVPQQESKFLAIKQIIETIKSDKSELMIKGKIDINASGLKNENEDTNLRFKNNSGK